MKTCISCNEIKPIVDFYSHKGMKDGHLNKCKDCVKSYEIKRRRDNDYVREYDRKRAKNPERKEKSARVTKEWRKNNPDGYKAHNAISNGIRSGKIVKKACEICGSKKTHAHHEDYSKPLEVRWLCPLHHHRHHHRK